MERSNFWSTSKTFQAKFLDLFFAVTILSHFLAHVPVSEHAPLLEYRRTEVNRNIYNIDAPTFSINSQNMVFLAIGTCNKKRNNTVWQSEIYTLLTLDIMSSNPRHKILVYGFL